MNNQNSSCKSFNYKNVGKSSDTTTTFEISNRVQEEINKKIQ